VPSPITKKNQKPGKGGAGHENTGPIQENEKVQWIGQRKPTQKKKQHKFQEDQRTPLMQHEAATRYVNETRGHRGGRFQGRNGMTKKSVVEREAVNQEKRGWPAP